MVITIENLIKTLNLDDSDDRIDQFTRMMLEAIATKEDNIIMNELMLDIIQNNSDLNKQLEIQLDEIKRLSVTDQLTGIYNRRKFIEVLDKEINRFTHYSHSFTLIMFDIDHFKNVNDTYGHDVGDLVLKELSSLVKRRLRASDTFSRWGGEEFMILAAETDSKEAKGIAENIRMIIEENDFSPVPQVTCSFGVMTCDKKSLCDITILSKKVDEALYKAKETGRNRVVVYEN
ncbi:MAG: GGDEF domain-containing protein [Clostridiales bacterium]|nr:GGDEF domain-containing protein [Clostridiales bacterium]